MASSTIRIYMKQPHQERTTLDVIPEITVKELKELAGLVAANLRFRGKPLKNGDVLSA